MSGRGGYRGDYGGGRGGGGYRGDHGGGRGSAHGRGGGDGDYGRGRGGGGGYRGGGYGGGASYGGDGDSGYGQGRGGGYRGGGHGGSGGYDGRGRGGGYRGGGHGGDGDSGGYGRGGGGYGRGGGGRGRGRGRVEVTEETRAAADRNPQKGIRFEGQNENVDFSIPRNIPRLPAQSDSEFLANFPPPKTLKAEIEELEEGEEELKKAVARPSTLGTRGRPIQLAANHFPIKFPENMRVLHYDVALAKIVTRPKRTAKAEASAKATKPKRPPKQQQQSDVREIVLDDFGDRERVLIKRDKWPRALILAAYTRVVWHSDIQPNLYEYRYKLAFDGMKNVFAQCNLGISADGKDFDLDLKDLDDPSVTETFRLTLKPAAVVIVDMKHVFNRNLIERKSISTTVLDVILRQYKLFNHVFIPIGRRVFYRPENPFPLGGLIERYPGIWESVRPISGWKSTVNLDVANTAFVKEGSLLDILPEVVRNYDNNPRNVQANAYLAKCLEKVVKGLKVDQMQRGPLRKRSSKCIGVSKVSAELLMFPIDTKEGKKENISVAKYFDLQHKKGEFVEKVRFPNLPCLQVGSKTKQNYIPIEFCVIKEGQRYPRKLDGDQTSNMLNIASQPAPERRQRIEERVATIKNTNENPYLRSFNINIETKMVEFNGRVLDAPVVQYAGKVIGPRDMSNGGWNMRGSRVLKGCNIGQWAVLCADLKMTLDQIRQWCQELVGIARNMNVIFNQNAPFRIEHNCDQYGALPALPALEALKKEASQKGFKLDLVIVVLPSGQQSEIDRYYGSIKSAGDVELGVNTQCVQSKNICKFSPSLLANICLKINAKMGGVNNSLDGNSIRQIHYLNEPILVLGADVNHPAESDGESAASIAAVVGCIDREMASYAARIMVQGRRVEIIENLKSAVHQMIDMYFERHRTLPKRIIMYRDGVGESMFLKVLTYELKQIRLACGEVFESLRKQKRTDLKKYEPPVTFIVVQKRHHTRLFCRNPTDQMGRGLNVPPGTVVDTDIVHPTEFDFYLCSHLGLQGTSRPGHYQVLWDDSNFTADDLQLLTYYLCYTYARATKSVSMPPPVYYADLTAFRARAYLSWKTQEGEGSSVTGTSSSSGPLTAEKIAELQNHVTVTDDIVKKGMFFV